MKIGNKWDQVLKEEFEKDYYKNISTILNTEYEDYTIYPKREDVFKALELTDFDQVKVVIIGQDPYHGPNQAQGLSFSVAKGVKIPPSLRNIYKELEADLGLELEKNGDLTNWAKEGVLLINSTLTVREKTPNSHKNIGWERFTDKIIEELNSRKKNIVYILWGNFARKKGQNIDRNNNLVIESVHPSPLSASRGFFGTSPFSRTNEYLIENNIEPIDWASINRG
mgnify:CR=1 FL=1